MLSYEGEGSKVMPTDGVFGWAVLTMTSDFRARLYGDWKGAAFKSETEAEALARRIGIVAPELEATVLPLVNSGTLTASSRKARDRD